jgi:hypothetical protein
MAYIGTDVNYGNIASQTGVGNGSTTPIATLTYTVPTSSSIIVTLDGVTQVPTTDYVATGTTLTFTSSVASPIAILVVFLGRSLDIGTPADNTVDSAQLVNGSVDVAHMSANSVDSDQYVDGSIDTIHIGNDQVTGAKLNPALVAGDIIYADGTDTINRLAKPASPANEVLTFATSATAPSWVAPATGGKVLSYTTVNENAVSSYTMLNVGAGYANHGLSEAGVDITPLNISLTPSATSSKILIIATLFLGIPFPSFGVMRLKRGIGTTASLDASYDFMNDGTTLVGTDTQRGTTKLISITRDTQDTQHFTFTDAPATTSAVNYVFNIRMEGDAGLTFWLNRNEYAASDYGSCAGVSSVTLLELGA